ncbi:hypothetical protein KIW84_071813 [Lathyrus oleraceus]|uniref:Uncharacterized protein n=1 Tax=Pisum sativum TaxID=3888 RepID=A0A9D4VJN7_PEA|nr:hypothetical protein KIW84_071813 [Pisum sativum]
MMLDVIPTKDNLRTSFYDAKRFVSKLGLEVRKIDYCINGCMLFYDNEFGTNDGALEECKFCKSPRYQVRIKDVEDHEEQENPVADPDEHLVVDGRHIIRPEGSSFTLSRPVAKGINRFIQLMYKKVWKSFGELTSGEKDEWFDKFKA